MKIINRTTEAIQDVEIFAYEDDGGESVEVTYTCPNPRTEHHTRNHTGEVDYEALLIKFIACADDCYGNSIVNAVLKENQFSQLEIRALTECDESIVICDD